MLYYTAEHEWIRVDGDEATVGITAHAVEELGDLVFLEVKLGDSVARGDVAAVVESVKAASDVYAPLSGEIVAQNDAAVDDPALVNASPEEDGWLFRVRLSAPDEVATLLDGKAYQALLG